MPKEFKNEKDVKAAVRAILDEAGAWHYMPVQTGYGVKGIPDFIACLRGKFLSVETKFGKNKESAWQKRQGQAIREARGLYFVINETNLDDLRKALGLLIGVDDV